LKVQKHSNGQIDFEPVFRLLNDELSKMDISLELVCAGGYVLQLHGYRATMDIDAFYISNAEIEAVIRKAGDEFGINRPDELWLNGSIASMNPKPPVEHYKLVYKFSNLEVNAVDIPYLVGMKLTSGREQDLIDVGAILKRDNDKEPFELLPKLIGMGFQIDISGLLDGYEKAHGMQWLEDFYKINEPLVICYNTARQDT
jgi:hypothetical protein